MKQLEQPQGEHTPLPWQVTHELIGFFGRKDAEFVVAAVNNHASLVAALEGLMIRFEQTGEAWMSDPAWIAAHEALSRVRE